MTSPAVPFIPETAPFSEEQRQWLNGFFAGLFSGSPAPGNGAALAAPAPPATQKKTVLILFGSQTGNAEGLAKKCRVEAEKRGFAPKMHALDAVEPGELQKESHLLLVTSTWGEGDPPDNAAGFWEKLHAAEHPRLGNLAFSVLALGDRNYEDFCGCGRKFDERLAELGARRLVPRVDCDTDYDAPAKAWLAAALDALAALDPAAGHHDEGAHMDAGAKDLAAANQPMRSDVAVASLAVSAPAAAAWSRTNPFPAKLLRSQKLTGDESAKDTRHYEISLAGSGLTYEVGDALGLWPTNAPELVDEILRALGCDGEEAVAGADGQPKPIRLALLRDYAIRAPHKEFFEALAARDQADAFLKDLINPNFRTELDKYLYGREIIDFLLDSPKLGLKPQEFVSLLRKLQPRLYSIASSLKAHPDEVHLTVDTLRYEAHGRRRAGVSSVFLAERVGA
ncbi:MAG: flavodoxin domain-containing protein, partial [Verrucomicrobia bacterium]|nr:flavodoxin domain-containing protein [Verrucomicrobiota bacterium]